jgi:hypothetical protein
MLPESCHSWRFQSGVRLAPAFCLFGFCHFSDFSDTVTVGADAAARVPCLFRRSNVGNRTLPAFHCNIRSLSNVY